MIGWCGEFADILLCIPLFPSFGVMICVLGAVGLVAESLRNHITWGTVCFFNNKTNFLDPGKKKKSAWFYNNQLDFIGDLSHVFCLWILWFSGTLRHQKRDSFRITSKILQPVGAGRNTIFQNNKKMEISCWRLRQTMRPVRLFIELNLFWQANKYVYNFKNPVIWSVCRKKRNACYYYHVLSTLIILVPNEKNHKKYWVMHSWCFGGRDFAACVDVLFYITCKFWNIRGSYSWRIRSLFDPQ